ncbi:MAG: hypothetical protein ACRDFW_14330, partial [bacterium]
DEMMGSQGHWTLTAEVRRRSFLRFFGGANLETGDRTIAVSAQDYGRCSRRHAPGGTPTVSLKTREK